MSVANLDVAVERMLAAYGGHFPRRVRELAEMITEATLNYRLQDEDDELTAVFRECIALYCAEHAIPITELQAAVQEYTTIDARAAALGSASMDRGAA